MKKWSVLFGMLFISGSIFAAPPEYHMLKTLQLGGEGFWDYLSVDDSARRLYVSHGTHVVVIDLETDKVAANIPDTPGVHGIVFAPEFNRGFISCGRSNMVLIFDLKSLKILGQVKTGINPDGILYDPASKLVFVSNARSNDMTIFDAATADVKGTISLGGKGESPQTDGKGKVYVNIEDLNEVVEIDIRKLAVTNHFAITPGEEPTGMAIDVVHHRIFSGCGNKIMTVLDTGTGKIIDTVPIGEGCDGVAFDAETGTLFAANGEGTLTVVKESSPGKFKAVETVPTRRGARTLTIDPSTHTVYLSAGKMMRPKGPGEKVSAPQPAAGMDSFVVMAVGK